MESRKFGHGAAKHVPEAFDSTLVRRAAFANGSVAADDLDRIAGLRPADQLSIRHHDQRFQFGDVFRDHSPEVPSIRDNQPDASRGDFGQQAKDLSYYCPPIGRLDPAPAAALTYALVELVALEYQARRGKIVLLFE